MRDLKVNEPLITIGITTYNCASTIRRAVESALHQKWVNKEIVIVDDCSSKDTLVELKKLSQEAELVRVFYQTENRGVAATRNRIIEEARGEWIVFFDDDDESDPDRIELQWKRCVDYEKQFANGSPSICHTSRVLKYLNGEQMVAGTKGTLEGKAAPHGVAVAENIILGTPMHDGRGSCATCSQMARRSTYKELGGFDERFRRSEDTEFNVRVAKAGGHFVGIAKPLVIQHMTKTSEKNLDDELFYQQLLLKTHKDIADKHGQYRFCTEWLRLKYMWLRRRYAVCFWDVVKLGLRHPLHSLRRVINGWHNLSHNKTFARFHNE